jgi:hypothetical protein
VTFSPSFFACVLPSTFCAPPTRARTDMFVQQRTHVKAGGILRLQHHSVQLPVQLMRALQSSNQACVWILCFQSVSGLQVVSYRSDLIHSNRRIQSSCAYPPSKKITLIDIVLAVKIAENII